MSFHNPDQYTEPQSGLEPTRAFDELYEQFMKECRAQWHDFHQSRKNLEIWERFKKGEGISLPLSRRKGS